MATLNGHSRISPTAEVGGHARSILADVIEVAELQVRLLGCDAGNAKEKTIRSVVALCAGVAAVLGAIPVLLAGSAILIASSTSLSLGSCLVIVGFIVCAIAVVAIMLSLRVLRKGFYMFQPSKIEFASNLAWLKSLISANN